MNNEQFKKLRAPFPPEQLGKLPKGGVQLDYVGHADVTDRLLSVDPAWTWEPMALDAAGLPALDGFGNLWIRLTVCGVTRPGVGDGKSMKECISDALRNAAMRFGVALDLWAKGDRHFGTDGHDAPEQAQQARTVPPVDHERLTRTKGRPTEPDPWEAPPADPVNAVKAQVWQAAIAASVLKPTDRPGDGMAKLRLAKEYTAQIGGELDDATLEELGQFLAALQSAVTP